MPISEIMLKDKDGFHYKHPERSCKRCGNYPCIEGMDKLLGDFAAYGCKKFEDTNIFTVGERRNIQSSTRSKRN